MGELFPPHFPHTARHTVWEMYPGEPKVSRLEEADVSSVYSDSKHEACPHSPSDSLEAITRKPGGTRVSSPQALSPGASSPLSNTQRLGEWMERI